MKTAERAHTPKELWESIKLDPSYNKALEQIDTELQYWPNFLKHKCKQRFTRLRQILIKRKKMKLEGRGEYKIVSRKAEKRENARLKKAEKSAVIENHVVQGLLNNLQKKKYNEIYNINPKIFEKVLEKENVEEDINEDFDENDYNKGYLEDISEESEENDDENNSEDVGDDEEIDNIFKDNKFDDSAKETKKSKKIGRKRKGPNIEYEVEKENTQKNVDYI